MTEKNTIDNGPVDEMEVYLSVFDLVVEMLKEPEHASVKMQTVRPYQKRNGETTSHLELKLDRDDGTPLLVVHVACQTVGEYLKCNHLAVQVTDGALYDERQITRFEKTVVPLYHYGDLSFGARFAAAYIVECALLSIRDEDIFMSVLARHAFDRAQDRLQQLYTPNGFPFYPVTVKRQRVEGATT